VISRRKLLAGAGVTAGALVAAGGFDATRLLAAAAPALIGVRRRLPSGRTYWLSGSGPVLVIGLHGSNLTAANVNGVMWVTGSPATTGWQQHAKLRGYRLALAEGVAGGSWNVGGGWPSGRQDDMAYLLDVVADAGATGPVFAAGFSAGGALAWRAAAEHPEVFAAAGSASGWAPVRPTTPLDCYHIHGTGDTTVPIRGGFVSIYRFTFPAAADEARLAPRGSRVMLYPTTGGHGAPGWMAEALWSFWTVDRLRP
jgi:poly(3-hydroxybutyrate) depolymerase